MEIEWITEILFAALGGLALLMLKWIRDDILSLKKEMNEKFENVFKGFEILEKENNDGFEKVDERFDKAEKDVSNRFDRVDKKIDNLQTSMHDLDLRMTTIEAEHRIYPWPMVVNEKTDGRRKPGRPKRVLTHKENS